MAGKRRDWGLLKERKCRRETTLPFVKECSRVGFKEAVCRTRVWYDGGVLFEFKRQLLPVSPCKEGRAEDDAQRRGMYSGD